MIVRAGRAHPLVMAIIHAQCFPPGEAWDASVMAGEMAMPGVAGFIDETGGMILIRVAADEAEILTLAVAPAVRRQGIGRALVEAAVAHARIAGAAKFFLEVSVKNHLARALYRDLGFTEVGRRKRYYSDGADALVLSLALTPGADAAP
ncbi:MAG TPA: GNAT family N-acetyltransferase [Acetobacteraceae bacterium]|nr:GNAT family N-acetyltransferase [Acetobacteraceae bacterium]